MGQSGWGFNARKQARQVIQVPVPDGIGKELQQPLLLARRHRKSRAVGCHVLAGPLEQLTAVGLSRFKHGRDLGIFALNYPC